MEQDGGGDEQRGQGGCVEEEIGAPGRFDFKRGEAEFAAAEEEESRREDDGRGHDLVEVEPGVGKAAGDEGFGQEDGAEGEQAAR